MRPRERKSKINQVQVDALLKRGQERGFITTSEVLHFLPDVEYDVEGLEKIYDDLLRERGALSQRSQEFWK